MAKKKYSINWENDEVVSFEVNGVQYENLDDIPDENDRLKLEAMMDSASDAEFDAEFAQAAKELEQMSKFPMEKVVLGVFTGVAILMLTIAGIATFNNIRKINHEESAPGRVVDVVMERSYVNEQDRVVEEFYYPVVQFTARDYTRRTVKMSEGSSSPSYEVGDGVVVLYDPGHPQDARIKGVGSSALMWILPSITGILGIGFLGAVIAVQWVTSKTESGS